MKTKSKYDISDIYVKPISKKQFDRFTPRTKRLKIAQDVLMRLEAGKIKARHGKYFGWLDPKIREKVWDAEMTPSWEESKRAILEKDAKTLVNQTLCEVCAKGACFLSWVANFNNASVEDMNSFEGDLPIEFKGFFPSSMWEAIEEAFENSKWSLKKVMQNIVDHKGNFKYKGKVFNDKTDEEDYNDYYYGFSW